MTSANYIKLFEIKAFHSFFRDSIARNLNYNLTFDMMESIGRFDFKLVNTPQGFDFYTNTLSPVNEYLEYITNQTGLKYFEFAVTASDPNFYSFTNFPIDKSGFFQFDSAFITEGDESQKILTSFFVESNDHSRVALIKVQIEDIQKSQNTQTPLAYSMKFETRKTQWNYYIIPGRNVQLRNPQIESDSSYEFTAPMNVTMPNNEEAFLFTSGEMLIPLKERPENRFTLLDYPETSSDNNNNRPKKITILPSANVNYFEIVTINDQKQMASPVYVYL